jgi:hypothetical protein
MGAPSAPQILFEHLLRSTQIKEPLCRIRDPCEHGHAGYIVLKVVSAPRPTVAIGKALSLSGGFRLRSARTLGVILAAAVESNTSAMPGLTGEFIIQDSVSRNGIDANPNEKCYIYCIRY